MILAAALTTACRNDEAPIGPPAAVRAVTATTFTADAGSVIPGGITVHVVDFLDRDIAGVKVAFSVTKGDGSVSQRLVATGADGRASTEWTIGPTAGENEVIASIFGTDSTAVFTATGNPGPAVGLALTPHTLRLPMGTNSGTVTASVVDQYGNVITGAAGFESKNPGLVSVNGATGAVTVESRGGTTYIIASGSGFKDSTYVVVLNSGDPPCTGITASASLPVGGVLTSGFSDNGICVAASATAGEYALVPYYESSVPSAQTIVAMTAFGVTAPASLGSIRPRSAMEIGMAASQPVAAPSFAHEQLRIAERREMPARAAGVREWYSHRHGSGRIANRTTAVPAVGDQMQINTNALDYCSNPTMATGRVAAVTQRAVVVADVANPEGFTNAEYEQLGRRFDTLVYQHHVSVFGAPTDIDENGNRIVLFYTHAVNKMGGGVLGYFFGRDLLPKSGPFGACPSSNVAEIMYLLVPDPNTFLNKDRVASTTMGTIAHEFQHLINGSRRLYINANAAPTEEVWLNEGLSHAAEELMFYRSTGLTPRQNIGSVVFLPAYSARFNEFAFLNFTRLRDYLQAVETQSPIGITDSDDDLATRGAAWAFLRYAADRRASSNETQFWFKLVNSNQTGMTNLYENIGPDARQLMRDWTISIYLDDLVPSHPDYQQPSWNLRQVMSGYSPMTRTLPNATTLQFAVRAGGAIFGRFAVAAGQEAYVVASGVSGTALPRYVKLALVRTK